MRRIVNISMPNMLYLCAEQRAIQANFGTLSEYIRNLIRKDLEELEKRKAESIDRDLRYRRDVLGGGRYR